MPEAVNVWTLAELPLGVAHVLSPRRKVVLFAVPEPSCAVGTVPLDRLLAFKLVRAEPLPECVPEKVPPVTVPLRVGEAENTALPVPVGVPTATPAILATVVAPELVIVTSPVGATAVATLEPLPTQIFALVRAGNAEEGVAHVPSPRQKVEELAAVPLFRLVTGRLPVT